jgi:hypothetical protein
MPNARKIIERAARKIGVLGRGQVMPAEEAQSALDELNGLVETLSAEGAAIFNLAKDTLTSTGAASYSVGSGGDLNISQPMLIENVFVTNGSIDYQLRQISAAEYAGIMQKDITGVPEVFYYDSSVPMGRLYLYPAASATYVINVWSRKPITAFANLTTDYDMLVGAEDMLVYNLAERLCPDYEKPVTPDVAKMAKVTKNAVTTLNRRNNYPTSVVWPTNGRGNVYNGWYT